MWTPFDSMQAQSWSSGQAGQCCPRVPPALPAHLVTGEPPLEAGAWKDSVAVRGVAEAGATARGAVGATVPNWNCADAAERVPRSSLAL